MDRRFTFNDLSKLGCFGWLLVLVGLCAKMCGCGDLFRSSALVVGIGPAVEVAADPPETEPVASDHEAALR